jgi:branched-chain amino acid transport system ATP-binding protein
MAILLVEQNVREALAIADRAYVMKAGRIVYCGPPADIDDHAKLMDLY